MYRSIATVMLVGLTIAMGGAVGSWVLNLWGREAEVEFLKIFSDAELVVDEAGNARLFLTIKNDGFKNAIIIRIVVERVGEARLNSAAIVPAGRLWRTPPEGLEVVPSNGAPVIPGEPYMIKVITDSGGVYHIIVRARSRAELANQQG